MYAPSVAMDADGDFVVAWEQYDDDPYEWALYVQRFHATGMPLGPASLVVEAVGPIAVREPGVAMDADGDFVVVWAQGYYYGYRIYYGIYGVHAQFFDAAGVPQGGPVQLVDPDGFATLAPLRPSSTWVSWRRA